MKATAQRPEQAVSYISVPSDWFVQQNTAVLGPPGVIWFICIMGAARVSKHIAHRDNKKKYARDSGLWPGFPTPGFTFLA